jgi:hypothetical protein
MGPRMCGGGPETLRIALNSAAFGVERGFFPVRQFRLSRRRVRAHTIHGSIDLKGPQGTLPSPEDPPEAIARYQDAWRRFEADAKTGKLPEHGFAEFR